MVPILSTEVARELDALSHSNMDSSIARLSLLWQLIVRLHHVLPFENAVLRPSPTEEIFAWVVFMVVERVY